MDEKSELFSLQTTSKFLKKNLLIIILILGGIIMIAIGLFQFFSKSDDSGIEYVSTEPQNSSEKLMVDISGAVINPGVYEFSQEDRISDAIEKAGGLTPDANHEFIDKNLNQAQNLADGMKLYIPFEGEEANVLGLNSASNQSGLVNLNSSSQSQLEELPKIGPVTAQKIISGRPYSKVDELLTRKIVGAAAFDQIKDLVTAP